MPSNKELHMPRVIAPSVGDPVTVDGQPGEVVSEPHNGWIEVQVTEPNGQTLNLTVQVERFLPYLHCTVCGEPQGSAYARGCCANNLEHG